MKRIAEARRREKEEDRRRKQRIREEIAKDRAERQARSKSETTPATAMQPPQPAAVQAPPAMKEHTEARLQVHGRLPNVVLDVIIKSPLRANMHPLLCNY